MTTPLLEGVLVDLVPYGNAFMARDHDWWNNESQFWGSMGGYNIATQAEVDREHKEWIESTRPRTGVAFGVQAKDGTPLGYIGYNWLIAHCRVANLGVVLGEQSYWGGGYGTDALLLLMRYSFDILDLRKVWLDTMALNARVLRQMEKVGFQLEARHRAATWVTMDWVDAVVFSFFQADWPGYDAMIARLNIQPR